MTKMMLEEIGYCYDEFRLEEDYSDEKDIAERKLLERLKEENL